MRCLLTNILCRWRTLFFTTECISGLNCDEKFCEPTNKADKWVRKYRSLANARLPLARYPPASEFARAFALESRRSRWPFARVSTPLCIQSRDAHSLLDFL